MKNSQANEEEKAFVKKCVQWVNKHGKSESEIKKRQMKHLPKNQDSQS